jgi:Tfp pilus assembly protein PilF
MKSKIVAAVIAMFALSSVAISQRSTSGAVSPIGLQITGFVRYGKTNLPAETVLVRLEASIGGHVDETQTDRNGRFMFSGLAGQDYEITVVAPGYLRAQQRVDLKTDNTAFVQIQLMPNDRSSDGTSSPASTSTINAKVPDAARKEFEKARSTLSDPKRLRESIRHLEKAVLLSSNFVEAQLLLGTTYMDVQQWDKAESSLQQLLKTNPNVPGIRCALGEVYLHAQKYNDAEEMLISGLRLDDSSFRGHLALGRVYYATGDLVKAGPEVSRAIQLKSDVPEAHLLAGNILFKQRQADKALPFFEDYLKLAPNGPYAGETRELVGRIKKAPGLPLG